jgi:D-alanyl-D-alanine carboxypeptidase
MLIVTLLAATPAAADTDRAWLAMLGSTVVDERHGGRPQSAASLAKLATAVAAVEALGANRRLPLNVHAEGDTVTVAGPTALVDEDVLWQLAIAIADRSETVKDVRVAPGPVSWRGRVAGDRPTSLYNPGIASILMHPTWTTTTQLEALGDGGRRECRPDSSDDVRIAVVCPHLLAGRLLAAFLSQLGMAARFDGEGEVRGPVIGAWPGPRVDGLVVHMLHDSDNAVAAFLGALVEDAPGAGLDRSLRYSPREVVATLQRLLGDDPRRLAWLPLAGRQGTLRGRFGRASLAWRVRAKSGTLDGVANLAGVVPCQGRFVYFAWMAEDAALANRDGPAATLDRELWQVEQQLAVEDWLSALLDRHCPAVGP